MMFMMILPSWEVTYYVHADLSVTLHVSGADQLVEYIKILSSNGITNFSVKLRDNHG